MLDTDSNLISVIEQALAERGMGVAAFGRVVANDSKLFKGLKDGRELRRELRVRLALFLAGEPLPPWIKKRDPKTGKIKKRKRVVQ